MEHLYFSDTSLRGKRGDLACVGLMSSSDEDGDRIVATSCTGHGHRVVELVDQLVAALQLADRSVTNAGLLVAAGFAREVVVERDGSVQVGQGYA